MTLVRLVDELRARSLSPREAVQGTLDRIDELDGTINAYITVRAEESLAEADAAPPPGVLHGAPIAVKDVIDVAGSPTTAGSRILADYRPARDAQVVARLRAAGAIMVGKSNTHEFAYGSTTTSPHFGPARNPWSIDRICGGSSGGSAAAIAANLASGSLGTDTAGSLRIPAALCGVTALRPSSGVVSLHGVIPVSPTFDTVGPIARSAEDCALLLSVVSGRTYSIQGAIEGLRIGVVQALFGLADSEVASVARAGVETLAEIGASVDTVEIPLLMQAGAIQQSIMLPEAASLHLEWLRTRLNDYGADVRLRLLTGLFLPAAAYVTGLHMRDVYRDGLEQVFERFDVLAAPTLPFTAPPLRPDTAEFAAEGSAYRRAIIPFNSPWSLAGYPVLSVPCGFSNGLPIGLSFVGRPNAEETVLRVGRVFQEITDWHDRHPTRLSDARTSLGPEATSSSRRSRSDPSDDLFSAE